MASTHWLKQDAAKPLFEDILWSRPETKQGSGKLAIIGGHSHGFSAPGIAYDTALNSQAGICKVLLPESIKKTVKLVLPDADFAPSNPSGSFGKNALSDLLQISEWSDAVLLAGDIGRNSETAILLESYVEKYQGLLVVTQDAVDYFKAEPKQLLERDHTAIVLSLAQLQKVFINTPLITPITYGMSMINLVDALKELTSIFPALICTKHNDTILISHNGRVVTQQFDTNPWRVVTAARASVFWMQNPGKPLEAIASSLVDTQ